MSCQFARRIVSHDNLLFSQRSAFIQPAISSQRTSRPQRGTAFLTHQPIRRVVRRQVTCRHANIKARHNKGLIFNRVIRCQPRQRTHPMHDQAFQISQTTRQGRIINVQLNHVRRVYNTSFRRGTAKNTLRPYNSSSIQLNLFSNFRRHKPNFNRTRQGHSINSNSNSILRRFFKSHLQLHQVNPLLNCHHQRRRNQVSISTFMKHRAKSSSISLLRNFRYA